MQVDHLRIDPQTSQRLASRFLKLIPSIRTVLAAPMAGQVDIATAAAVAAVGPADAMRSLAAASAVAAAALHPIALHRDVCPAYPRVASGLRRRPAAASPPVPAPLSLRGLPMRPLGRDARLHTYHGGGAWVAAATRAAGSPQRSTMTIVRILSEAGVRLEGHRHCALRKSKRA